MIDVKIEDLITIIHMYMSIFRGHLLWGNINEAVDAGTVISPPSLVLHIGCDMLGCGM